MVRIVALFSMVLLGALLGRAAFAGAAEDPARLLLDGLEKMRAGEYDEALRRFERAYVLSRDPRILVHAADAYAAQGRCVPARIMYRTSRRLLPDEPEPAADSALGRCLSPDPSTEPGAAEPERDEELPPPLSPADPRGPQPSPERGRISLPGLLTLGGGVALALGGLYFGIQAQKAGDRVAALYQRGGLWTPEYQEIEADGRRDSTVSLILLVAGGAAMVTGGFLLVLHRPGESVAAVPLDGGAALVWTCGF